MNFAGFTNAAFQIGVQSIVIKPVRGIFAPTLPDGSTLPEIFAQATVEETHHDDLEITDHPIEQGAAVTDHAFKRPAEVILRLGWSNSPAAVNQMAQSAVGLAAANSPTVKSLSNLVGIASAASSLMNGGNVDQINSIYQRLLEIQAKRALFILYTGKRVYTDMLCKSLSTHTDNKTANSLIVTMTCRQVILVNTQTVSLTKEKQATPEKTASIVDQGKVQGTPATVLTNAYTGPLTLSRSAYSALPISAQYSFTAQGGLIQ